VPKSSLLRAAASPQWWDEQQLVSHKAVARAVACSLYPHQRTVISPLRCSRLGEQRSGEIRFSTEGPSPTSSFPSLYDPRNLFFAFSAQKSRVKPQNNLTPSNKRK